MPLNFEPAERTRGGYQYRQFGEIPSPHYYDCPITGAIKIDGAWQLASWSVDGRHNGLTLPHGHDLIPITRHRYANIYRDQVPVWYEDLTAATSTAHPDRLCILIEVKDVDGIHYQLLKETNDAT